MAKNREYTPEEMAEIHRERTLSDSDQIKNYAEYTPEGVLEFTKGQVKEAHDEMRYEIDPKYRITKDLKKEME